MFDALSRPASAGRFRLGRRTRLLLALALGLVAAVLVARAASRSPDATLPSAIAEPVTAPVVIATRTIPAGATITPGMVTVVEIDASAAAPLSLRDPGAVVGRVARVPIYPGEQLLSARLAERGAGADGLRYTVPEGLRALAVTVDKVVGAGGLLQPGDHVDVIAVLADAANLTAGGVVVRSATTIAQDVVVLAVEQELINLAVDAPATDPLSGTLLDQADPQPKGTVATLAVSPASAEQIFLAEETGAIRLAVRAPGDVTVVSAGSAGERASPSEPPLAALVPDGLRALAVGVDTVIGVGGLLRPGDRVDVVGVIGTQTGPADLRDPRAVTIAQDVAVLAVEQVRAGGEGSASAAGQPRATVVTLAVSPAQAQAILLVDAEGVIRLSLRSPADADHVVLGTDSYTTVTGNRGAGGALGTP